jgi:hypothetical protein
MGINYETATKAINTRAWVFKACSVDLRSVSLDR